MFIMLSSIGAEGGQPPFHVGPLSPPCPEGTAAQSSFSERQGRHSRSQRPPPELAPGDQWSVDLVRAMVYRGDHSAAKRSHADWRVIPRAWPMAAHEAPSARPRL